MTTTHNYTKPIVLKQGRASSPVAPSAVAFGRRGFLFLDSGRTVALIGPAAQLAAQLRAWADRLEGRNEPA